MRHLDSQEAARLSFADCHHLAAFYYLDENGCSSRSAPPEHHSCSSGRFHRIPVKLQGFDVCLRHHLDPDVLPNPRTGRIPDAVRMKHLLPSWLDPFRCWVSYRHENFVIAPSRNDFCNVERKRIVSPSMDPQDPSVKKHSALPVDRPEMQNRPEALSDAAPFFGKFEETPVPSGLLRQKNLAHPRERRLNRKWNADGLIESGRSLKFLQLLVFSRCLDDLEVPNTVQRKPR